MIEDFETLHQTDVEYVAVGTGAALQLGRTGDVDALIVHAPALEAQFIAEGHASERIPFAYNAFVLLSPITLEGSIFDVFETIATEGHCFVSRGDDSGTHAKEQAIWLHLNETKDLEIVEDSNGIHPPGEWYYSIGKAWAQPSTWRTKNPVYVLRPWNRPPISNTNRPPTLRI